jgi:hypothetical protein
MWPMAARWNENFKPEPRSIDLAAIFAPIFREGTMHGSMPRAMSAPKKICFGLRRCYPHSLRLRPRLAQSRFHLSKVQFERSSGFTSRGG